MCDFAPYFNLRDYGHEGQIGLEQTPEEYIDAMVEVFRCVRDVLADDGTLWVNIGDSWGDGKQLMGIPWRVALALQSDGWVLRQDIIWHKPNPMPESVRDRCTKSHEYVFLLSKGPRYFFDYVAIKEPATCDRMRGSGPMVNPGTGRNDADTGTVGDYRKRSKADSFRREGSKRAQVIPGQTVGTHREDRAESEYDTKTRNKRDVWSVPTRGYGGAHFAVFPPALIEPCILAGSRPGDIVLDPFMGSGTTAAVALQHDRQYLGCELNPEYGALQQERIAEFALPLFD